MGRALEINLFFSHSKLNYNSNPTIKWGKTGQGNGAAINGAVVAHRYGTNMKHFAFTVENHGACTLNVNYNV
ncbi:MAG: hypothetical protein PHR16_07070 [Methylovulum sp.]|nr:hypothetical protein [Methylovulum sp.]